MGMKVFPCAPARWHRHVEGRLDGLPEVVLMVRRPNAVPRETLERLPGGDSCIQAHGSQMQVERKNNTKRPAG